MSRPVDDADAEVDVHTVSDGIWKDPVNTPDAISVSVSWKPVSYRPEPVSY